MKNRCFRCLLTTLALSGPLLLKTAAEDNFYSTDLSGSPTVALDSLKHWPDQFAVAVVEVIKPPTRREDNDMVYFWIAVRPVDLISINWLNPDPKSPDDQFNVHYWYPKNKGGIAATKGEKLLVFLAPTHFQDSYDATAVMTATAENVAKVRKALARSSK